MEFNQKQGEILKEAWSLKEENSTEQDPYYVHFSLNTLPSLYSMEQFEYGHTELLVCVKVRSLGPSE